MQRRSAIEYRKGLRSSARLTELDYLLGVHDSYRMGGIRFKAIQSTDFLDNNTEFSAMQIERDENIDSDEYYRWLKMLISPGSSLGGARPKACVTGENHHLWIAKFPNQNDTFDVGAWEMLCYELALSAGVDMFPSEIYRFTFQHHTFLTKLFDGDGDQRSQFSSAKMQHHYYDVEQ